MLKEHGIYLLNVVLNKVLQDDFLPSLWLVLFQENEGMEFAELYDSMTLDLFDKVTVGCSGHTQFAMKMVLFIAGRLYLVIPPSFVGRF